VGFPYRGIVRMLFNWEFSIEKVCYVPFQSFVAIFQLWREERRHDISMESSMGEWYKQGRGLNWVKLG